MAAVTAHLALAPLPGAPRLPLAPGPGLGAAGLAPAGLRLSPSLLPLAAPLAAPPVAPLAAPSAALPAAAHAVPGALSAGPIPAPDAAPGLAPAAPAPAEPLPVLSGLRALAEPGADAPRVFDGLAPAPAAPADGPLSRAAKGFAPLAAATLATAGLDIAVVEGVLHPAKRAGTPWSDFETVIGGYKILNWWFFFIPFSLGLLGWAGWRKARWRGAAAGALLFVSGCEDILYYWLRLSSLPEGLGWLDANPFIGWTRAVTGTPSVTGEGVLLSASLGLGAALLLLAKKPKRG